jgi:catechol 2,3-dioxygenase-like lactoylglutathione lyase family enzyme
MATVSVRYIVHDVEESISFYRDRLGFELVMHPAPPFAMLVKGDLRLLLSAPSASGGGGQSLPDGSPTPGGWNRFTLEVEDLDEAHDRLVADGVTFRSGVIVGVGGRQALAQDPSGNLVELFEPTRDEARLGG